MHTPSPKDNSDDQMRSVTSSLHPWVYATLIVFVLWFVLWSWSFAGAGVTDYLLVIVSSFFLVVVALTLILLRVGHKDPATGDNEAKADDKPELFHDWAASDFDTYAGRLSSFQATTLILLPIAVAAFGMTGSRLHSSLSNMAAFSKQPLAQARLASSLCAGYCGAPSPERIDSDQDTAKRKHTRGESCGAP